MRGISHTMYCFLQLFIFCLTSRILITDAGHYSVKTKDEASLMSSIGEIPCEITYNDTGSGNSDVNTSYTVYWNFTALGSKNPITVLSLDGMNSEVTFSWSASDKYNLSGRSNLKILDVTNLDAGTYVCVAVTEDIVVSSAAELYVVEPPTCHNSKNTYMAGERTEFDCTVGYIGKKPPDVFWVTGNMPVNATHLQIKKNIIKATLGIKTRAGMNGHTYNCQISYTGIFSTLCRTNSPLLLSVSYPVEDVKILVYPSTPNRNKYWYPLGTEIKLYCNGNGNPQPKFYWTFSPADGSGFKSLNDNHHYIIHNASFSDQGNYTCTAISVIKNISYNKLKTINIKIAENGPVINTGYGYQHISHNTDSKISGSDGKNGRHTDNDNSSDINISPYAIGAIVTAALAILLIVVFIMLVLKFKARDRRMRQQFSRIHDENLDDQEVELLDENIQPVVSNNEPPRLKQFWEIPQKDIKMSELISRGSYVEVWKGRMRKYPEKEEVIRIAIKKISDEATEKDRKFFLAEMEVLKMLKSHINVIQIIGCYTLNEPWLIMLEYAQDGTLFEYLQKGRPGDDLQEVEITSNARQSVKLKKKRLDSYRLLALAAQVANGLEHLNRFKLIYYRLRTLSVLMAKGGICKLSGFGFPHDIRERNLYEANSAPIRWMSPESIRDNTFNVKTDVWSYGITMWEILHFGTAPYPEMGPQEAEESILSSYVMPCPPHCSEKVYNIMLSCWDQKPDNRPGYNTILQWLTGLAAEHSSHVNLEKLPNFLDENTTSSPDTNSSTGNNEVVT